MEVFSLRPLRISAFSALMGLSRREPQRYAEAAEKTNKICHFLCKAVLKSFASKVESHCWIRVSTVTRRVVREPLKFVRNIVCSRTDPTLPRYGTDLLQA